MSVGEWTIELGLPAVESLYDPGIKPPFWDIFHLANLEHLFDQGLTSSDLGEVQDGLDALIEAKSLQSGGGWWNYEICDYLSAVRYKLLTVKQKVTGEEAVSSKFSAENPTEQAALDWLEAEWAANGCEGGVLDTEFSGLPGPDDDLKERDRLPPSPGPYPRLGRRMTGAPGAAAVRRTRSRACRCQ